MSPPWPFILVLNMTLLCWNLYLISFIPKRIQLIRVERKIFRKAYRLRSILWGTVHCVHCAYICVSTRKREVTKIRKLPYVFSHRKWHIFVFWFLSSVPASQSLCLTVCLSQNGKPSLKKLVCFLKFHTNLMHQWTFLAYFHEISNNKQLELL